MYSNMNLKSKSANLARLAAFLTRNSNAGGSVILDSGASKAKRSAKAEGRAVGFPDGRAVFFKA